MKVAIIMGSDSDWRILETAYKVLCDFNIETEVTVASAHRSPEKVHDFAANAEQRGVQVIIAAAGAAAHLPGVIAAYTTLPVLGVPIDSTSLGGLDALLSIVQMPAGIPVGTMAINGAKNAAIFAAEILAVSNTEVKESLVQYRLKMREEVELKAAKIKL